MNVGGAETFLMKVLRHLNRKEYRFDFAVADEQEGFYDEEILSLGGKIFHISSKSHGVIRNFCSLKNIVKDNHYKYVLRVSQHSLSAVELLAAWMGGCKVRVFRSSNSCTRSGNKVELFLHYLFIFMPIWFANVRIAPSTEAAEFMFGKKCIDNGRAHLLHNAIDLNEFRYDVGLRSNCRKEFQIENKTVIGHIGRFNQQKNHLFLLKVFKQIKVLCPDAILVLVGVGELNCEIKQKADEMAMSDSIIFTGLQSDISRFLSAFDVFIFPSKYEGMPNTVIEAQATGLPCLISDSITKEVKITELVKFLPLSSSPLIWAESALKLIQNNRIDTRQTFIESKYNIESMVEQFAKFIFQVG